MMSRIKDAEYAQTVAEMTQRIADLEIQVRSWPLVLQHCYLGTGRISFSFWQPDSFCSKVSKVKP